MAAAQAAEAAMTHEQRAAKESQKSFYVKRFEIAGLACVGLDLSSNALSKAATYSAYHPPAVIRKFSYALLRQAFDSPQVKEAFPALHMPNDVLHLIADYAPERLEDLPHVMLTQSSYGRTPADTAAAGAIGAGSAVYPPGYHAREKSAEFTWASKEDRKAVAKTAGGRSLWKMEDDTKPKKIEKTNRWGGRRASSEEDE